MRAKNCHILNIGFIFFILFVGHCCLGETSSKVSSNLLPNGSFELDITGRDYQISGIVSSHYLDMMSQSEAVHGRRSLFLTSKTLLTTRMVHSQPGDHVFSFYAKIEGHGKGHISAKLNANPFICGRPLPSFTQAFKVSSNKWVKYTLSADLPMSKDNWYWLELDISPPSNGKIFLDGLILGRSEQSEDINSQEAIEFNLTMDGDFTKVYKENSPLPPIKVNAYNPSDKNGVQKIQLMIKDFWQRTLFDQTIKVEIPSKQKITREISVSLSKKGPFRAELYLADERLLQDELIFSIVPEIAQPVLATQYGNPSSELRYMYKTLGFKYAGQHTPTKWSYIQPDDVNHWDWKNVDKYYEGLAQNFDETTQVMLWSVPKWAYIKKDKKRPFPPSLPASQQFDLDDYLHYVEMFARRYPKWIYLQPWNEPWHWKPAEFVEFLRHCRERFDQVNPKIKILGPTSYPLQSGWMDGFLQAGGLKYCDILAIHAYPGGGGYIPETLAVLKQWAQYDGNLCRPIWNTETALHPYHIMTWYTGLMPSNTGTWADGVMAPAANASEEAAERWTKMYITQSAMGVSRFFSHVSPQHMSPLPRLANLSHAEPDGGRSPVAIGWAVAGHRIGSAEPLGCIEVSPHLRVMLFRQGNLLKAAIWTREFEALQYRDPIAANLFYSYKEAVSKHRGMFRNIVDRPEYLYELSVGDKQINIYDMFDNPISAEKTEGNNLTFTVSCRPTYLEVQGMSQEQFCETLRRGQLIGMRSFETQVSLGRSASGEVGIIADVTSCTSELLELQAKCSVLSDKLQLTQSKETLILQPLRRRQITFPLTKMPLIMEGLTGFKVDLTNGKSVTTISIPELWMITASYQDKVQVDGDLVEWENIPYLTINNEKQAVRGGINWQGSQDASCKLQAAWDKNNLYFAMQVMDDQLVEKRGYTGDCIELFFDADVLGDLGNSTPDSDDRQYFVNAPMENEWPNGTLSAAGTVTGGMVRAKKIIGGYQTEVRIPWDNFRNSGFIPRNNEVIGFVPTVCDRDSEGSTKLVWTAKDNVYQDTSKFGRMILIGGPQPSKVNAEKASKGVLSSWRFNRNSILLDKGVTGFDGKVIDAVYHEFAREGACLKFNGTSALVEFSDSNWQCERKKFEICFMMENSEPVNELLWREPISPGWRYRGIVDKTGKLRFELCGPDGKSHAMVVSRTIVRQPGVWFTAAYEWDVDKKTLTLFINDKKEDETTFNVEMMTHDLTVGGSKDENLFFAGYIQWVTVSTPIRESFRAKYSFENVRKEIIEDEGTEQIDGQMVGPLTHVAEGHDGSCLFFNGVDNLVLFPAGFSGAQDRITLWICPASNPEDSILERFSRRFKGNYLDFHGYRAYKDRNKQPDWGVMENVTTFKSRMSRRQFIFAADSKDSGFRMQAWLEPDRRTLAVCYAAGKMTDKTLRYSQLESKSQIWTKGIWNKIELVLDQAQQQMSLFVNSKLEAQTPLYTAVSRVPYMFSLGGSQRNGLPFYGKIDEFEVSSSVDPQHWIFPEGNFKYPARTFGSKLKLAYPFEPIGLKTSDDKANVIKFGSSWFQEITVNQPDSGILTQVFLPLYKKTFSVGFNMRSKKEGDVNFLISPSPDPKLVFVKKKIHLNELLKEFSYENVVKGDGGVYLIFLFDKPGTYQIGDLWIY